MTKEDLDKFFSHIINNRVDTRWTPSLHAAAEVAAAYPEVAGMSVAVDRYCDPGSIELRAETGKLLASIAGLSVQSAE